MDISKTIANGLVDMIESKGENFPEWLTMQNGETIIKINQIEMTFENGQVVLSFLYNREVLYTMNTMSIIDFERGTVITLGSIDMQMKIEFNFGG